MIKRSLLLTLLAVTVPAANASGSIRATYNNFASFLKRVAHGCCYLEDPFTQDSIANEKEEYANYAKSSEELRQARYALWKHLDMLSLEIQRDTLQRISQTISKTPSPKNLSTLLKIKISALQTLLNVLHLQIEPIDRAINKDASEVIKIRDDMAKNPTKYAMSIVPHYRVLPLRPLIDRNPQTLPPTFSESNEFKQKMSLTLSSRYFYERKRKEEHQRVMDELILFLTSHSLLFLRVFDESCSAANDAFEEIFQKMQQPNA